MAGTVITRKKRRWLGAARGARLAPALVALSASPAFAQTTGAPPRGAVTQSSGADAERLFGEGKALYEQDRFEQACAKFDESRKIRPGIGTDYHLADCWERVGRVASAHALFLEVAQKTQDLGQTQRSENARERAAKLAPRISRLVIVSRPVEGLEVRQNGAVVSGIDVGKAYPLDPGEYEISLSAPGKRPWTKTIHVPRDEPSVLMVELPDLSPERKAAVAPPAHGATLVAAPRPVEEPAPAQETKPSAFRTGAMYALAGVGVIGLGVGTAFITQAVASAQDANAACPDDRNCTASETEIYNSFMGDARSDRNWAIGGFAAGSLALASATYLYFTDPARDDTKAGSPRPLAPAALVAPGFYGAVLHGRF